MAQRPTRKSIDFVQLVADHKNPRLPRKAESSRAALLGVVRTQRDKIVEMAVDIAENGLNPGEALYVMPSEDGDDFVVLEGNRRFTALKLLQDPSLADGCGISSSGAKRLREASRSASIPEQVDCVVFDSRDAAAPWLVRRHTGQRDGAGLVRWGSVERARFEYERTGVKSAGLAVLDYVLDNTPDLDGDVRTAAEESFALTNLERILDDVKAQARMGVSVSSGRAVTTLYGARLLALLTKMVSDVATWLTVTRIDNSELRASYLDGLKDYLPTDMTPRAPERLVEIVPSTEPEPEPTSGAPHSDSAGKDTKELKGSGDGGTSAGAGAASDGGGARSSGGTGGAGNGGGFSGGSTGGGGGSPASRTSGGKGGSGQKGPSKDRKGVFPRGTTFYIKNRRVNDLFHELKVINLDKFPNAAAVLFRVFLELSTDVLIDKEPTSAPQKRTNGSGQPIEPRLWQKLISTIDFLDKQGKLPPKYAEVAKTATTAVADPASTRAMNISVHNVHAAPTGGDVKAAWDVFEHYVKGLWALIAEKH